MPEEILVVSKKMEKMEENGCDDVLRKASMCHREGRRRLDSQYKNWSSLIETITNKDQSVADGKVISGLSFIFLPNEGVSYHHAHRELT